MESFRPYGVRVSTWLSTWYRGLTGWPSTWVAALDRRGALLLDHAMAHLGWRRVTRLSRRRGRWMVSTSRRNPGTTSAVRSAARRRRA